MKTYWDYSERERSRMTQEEVQGLMDVELMTKGVKKIEAPVLKEIKAVSVGKEVWFEVDGVYFKSADDCQKFLALSPKKAMYDYACGYDYTYATEIDTRIEQKELYSRQGLLDLATVLKENKAAKEYNEKVTNEYEKAVKGVLKVTNGVWEDWYVCRDKAARLKGVINTSAEYVRLADGNKEVARQFLLKIYTEDEIKEAEEWFNEGEERG